MLFGYKIIIPKEEVKQKCILCNTYPQLEGTDKCESCYSVIRNSLEQNPMFKDSLLPDVRKPKQETLEEAKKKFADVHKKEWDMAYEFGRDMYSFEKGAKWQAERMYSEEELQQKIDSQ